MRCLIAHCGQYSIDDDHSEKPARANRMSSRTTARCRAFTVHAPGRSRTVAGVIMGPWFDASRSERRAALHEELNRLSRAYRTVVILCGLEGRPIEQVAIELRIPVTSLERRLSRALDCLRVNLARRYYSIPSGIWDSDILRDLEAIVPETLIQSTVVAATCCPSPSIVSMKEGDYMSTDS
jgi:Sigma-70, region 4